jgi:hypothetical protein
MLTPEEMARIEEEERTRHAAELYRREVRERLQQTSAQQTSALTKTGPSFLKIAGILLLCVVGIMIATNLSSNSAAKEPGTRLPFSPSVRYIPKTDSIASGQIVVRHGGTVFYRFTVTPQMRTPLVSGNFTASGGSGNDVQAVIADEMNYSNWANGHQASAFWTTQGPETTGQFEVQLRPGTYYLAFSNRMSVLSDKYVFVNASLKYQEMQSY